MLGLDYHPLGSAAREISRRVAFPLQFRGGLPGIYAAGAVNGVKPEVLR